MARPPLTERIKEEKQDIDALMQRRTEQSQRDKQRSRDAKAAMYREEMERRIEDCLRMNGKIP